MAACQSVEQPVAHDRLVRFFDDLVFGTDYALDSERPKNIRKWTETVRVKIMGDDAQKHRPPVPLHDQGRPDNKTPSPISRKSNQVTNR